MSIFLFTLTAGLNNSQLRKICIFVPDELDVNMCEPWNSVKVRFKISKDSAEKLADIALLGDKVF